MDLLKAAAIQSVSFDVLANASKNTAKKRGYAVVSKKLSVPYKDGSLRGARRCSRISIATAEAQRGIPQPRLHTPTAIANREASKKATYDKRGRKRDQPKPPPKKRPPMPDHVKAALKASKQTPEYSATMSKALLGKKHSKCVADGTREPMSQEHRDLRGASMSKLKHCNNGVISKRLAEIPEGWVPGRLKKATRSPA